MGSEQKEAPRRSSVEGSTEAPKRPGEYIVGRAPWYDVTGQERLVARKPFIIGVTGGTASGKTTVCSAIIDQLNIPWVVRLSMDSFYRPLTAKERENAHDYNFDHPDAFDWTTMRDCLRDLRQSKSVRVPKYDFKTHSRLAETEMIYGADVVIVEGILVLHEKEIRDQLDMQIFVDTDADLRLARRLKRDIVERGRTVDGVLHQYTKTVKPSFDDFIYPTKRYADIIIPYANFNRVAVELLVQHVRSQLERRGVDMNANMLRLNNLNKNHTSASRSSLTLPATVRSLPHNNSVKALLTSLRNQQTTGDDLRHTVARLSRLLFNEGFDLLPFKNTAVMTPTDAPYDGKELNAQLCGVSIVRSGEALEVTLKELYPHVPIGKIVIKQTSSKADGPRLYYCKFPTCLKTSLVVLMDGILATGNATIMAVQVLLDHGVAEENIYFFCLIAAPQGLQALLNAFPKLHVVVANVEEGLDQHHYCVPGIGAFGDRYFGTADDKAAARVLIR
jgi:uridine kinase